MAKMIPLVDPAFIENDAERLVYEQLSKLPETYTVFYSFKWDDSSNWVGSKRMGEADFVVYHPLKGYIVFEVKRGNVTFREGTWYYQNGEIIQNPLEQARTSMFYIEQRVKNIRSFSYPNSFSAVWFPHASKTSIKGNLPADYRMELIFTSEDLIDIELKIERVFRIKKQTIEFDSSAFIRSISPEFRIVMSLSNVIEDNNRVFNSLTKDQSRILDYLEDQESAVIHGSAGTGKTMIAIEKALRCVDRGDKVLFICFNAFLKQNLQNRVSVPNLSIENVHSLAAKLLKSQDVSEDDLTFALNKQNFDQFEFDSIIIDEGQDFRSDIINKLYSLTRKCFFVFYDKYQLIQKDAIPSWIVNADCKLNLTKNCRNTIRIAKTSVIPINIESKSFERSVEGSKPYIFSGEKEDVIENLELLIQNLLQNEKIPLRDIVILTIKTEDKSILFDSSFLKKLISNKDEKQRLLFTSVRKFKGLESEIVIIIDIDIDSLNDENAKRIMYVASSRAKNILYMFASGSSDDANKMAAFVNNIPKLRVGHNALIRAFDGQKLDIIKSADNNEVEIISDI